MACQDCRYLYMIDRLTTIENCLRRVLSVMTFSENSSDVMDAKNRSIRDLDAFNRKWAVKHECPHQTVQVPGEAPPREGDIEPFVPPIQTITVPLVEEGGNVGVHSVPKGAMDEANSRTTASTKGAGKGKAPAASSAKTGWGGGRGKK